MPKAYSDAEREYIKARLKEEASNCLVKYGVRHTTVDEIVQRVNIPKGTFYLFYQSKEMLLFDVIQEQQNQISRELYEKLSAIADKPSVEELTGLILQFYKQTESMLLLKLQDLGEAELLMRKLPPEIVKAQLNEDADMIEKMLTLLPLKKKTNKGLMSAIFHAIYYATLHKSDIDEDVYDDALYLLIKGIVIQMM